MTTAKWANIGDDAGALPALIQRIPAHVPLELIDYLWIFPPRRIAIGESTVVVVGAFDEDAARRRVFTAHFTVSRSRKGEPSVNLRFDEHGSAPTDAVPRIVSGVLRRLGEDTDASPREEAVAGSADAWDALIADLGGTAESSAAPPDDSSPAPDTLSPVDEAPLHGRASD